MYLTTKSCYLIIYEFLKDLCRLHSFLPSGYSLFNSVNNGGIKAREAAEDDLIKP